jgi:dephospho-CoA kinase
VPALGITGGVATGKSVFAAVLCRYLSAKLFDADQCAHDLLAQDPGIQKAILAAFGDETFDRDGRPNRARLREIVFADGAKRRELEQILHPAIRARWMGQAQDAARDDCWFCADIPLLYETNAQSHFTAVIVVACTPETQRARLLEQRHLSTDLASQIVTAQFDLATKIAQADYLIWTDSTASSLDRQARLLAGSLQHRFPHG